jgi:hypothetical protein
MLNSLGQSLWLDNITRELLDSGTLKSYIDELSVTGLTSNPTIFDHAIKNSNAYDEAIHEKLEKGKMGGCHWRCPLSWPMTLPVLLPQLKSCMHAPDFQTF